MPDERPSDHGEIPDDRLAHGDPPGPTEAPDPAPAAPRARRKPSGRRSPAAPPALPPHPDAPPPGAPFLSLRLHGPEEQVIGLVERLTRDLPVVLCVDAYVTLPDAVWEPYPPNFLTCSQRDLVREDLRLSSTAEIARTLHLGRKTINSYRTRIRKQFTGIADAERPGWMQAWLRRYPGLTASRHSATKGALP